MAFTVNSVWIGSVQGHAESVALCNPTGTYRQMSLPELQVPEMFGHVNEFFQGSSGRTVVLIQDAHAVPEAQKNIRQVIAYFQKEFGLNLVTLEGASGALDTQLFRSFPDQERLIKVFEEYAAKGDLAGGPDAAVFGGAQTLYRGVEDWDLYEQGVMLYQHAIAQEPMIREKLKRKRKKLSAEKVKSYSKQLLHIDQLLENFSANYADFLDVLEDLSAVKYPAADSELAFVLEQMRSDAASGGAIADRPLESGKEEIRRIADEIHKYLAGSAEARELKKLEEFHARTQQYRTSQMTEDAYSLYLREIAKSFRLPVRLTHEFKGKAVRQKRLEDLKGTKLFRDFERYAEEVKEGLFRNPLERELNDRTRLLHLLERLSKLELGWEDWNLVKSIVDRPQTMDHRRLSNFRHHLAFYETAEKRDPVFLNNILKWMGESGKKDSLSATSSAIFVAGGFHTEGMKRLLREQGISYVLVTPRMESIPERINYQSQMFGELSWKDYFKAENGRVNLYEAMVRSTRDRLMAARSIGPRAESDSILKLWRDQILRDLSDQKRIAEAPQYTRFLDEIMPGRTKENVWQAKLVSGARKFTGGLRQLYSGKQITQDNVLQLLKSSMTQSLIVASFQSDRSVAQETIFPRSEIRDEKRTSRTAESVPSVKVSTVHSEDREISLEEANRIFSYLGPSEDRSKLTSIRPSLLMDLLRLSKGASPFNSALRAAQDLVHKADMFFIHGDIVYDRQSKKTIVIAGLPGTGKTSTTTELVRSSDGRFQAVANDSIIAYSNDRGELFVGPADYSGVVAALRPHGQSQAPLAYQPQYRFSRADAFVFLQTTSETASTYHRGDLGDSFTNLMAKEVENLRTPADKVVMLQRAHLTKMVVAVPESSSQSHYEAIAQKVSQMSGPQKPYFTARLFQSMRPLWRVVLGFVGTGSCFLERSNPSEVPGNDVHPDSSYENDVEVVQRAEMRMIATFRDFATGRPRVERLLDIFGEGTITNILDVGTGTADWIKALQADILQGRQLYKWLATSPNIVGYDLPDPDKSTPIWWDSPFNRDQEWRDVHVVHDLGEAFEPGTVDLLNESFMDFNAPGSRLRDYARLLRPEGWFTIASHFHDQPETNGLPTSHFTSWFDAMGYPYVLMFQVPKQQWSIYPQDYPETKWMQRYSAIGFGDYFILAQKTRSKHSKLRQVVGEFLAAVSDRHEMRAKEDGSKPVATISRVREVLQAYTAMSGSIQIQGDAEENPERIELVLKTEGDTSAGDILDEVAPQIEKYLNLHTTGGYRFIPPSRLIPGQPGTWKSTLQRGGEEQEQELLDQLSFEDRKVAWNFGVSYLSFLTKYVNQSPQAFQVRYVDARTAVAGRVILKVLKESSLGTEQQEYVRSILEEAYVKAVEHPHPDDWRALDLFVRRLAGIFMKLRDAAFQNAEEPAVADETEFQMHDWVSDEVIQYILDRWAVEAQAKKRRALSSFSLPVQQEINDKAPTLLAMIPDPAFVKKHHGNNKFWVYRSSENAEPKGEVVYGGPEMQPISYFFDPDPLHHDSESKVVTKVLDRKLYRGYERWLGRKRIASIQKKQHVKIQLRQDEFLAPLIFQMAAPHKVLYIYADKPGDLLGDAGLGDEKDYKLSGELRVSQDGETLMTVVKDGQILFEGEFNSLLDPGGEGESRRQALARALAQIVEFRFHYGSVGSLQWDDEFLESLKEIIGEAKSVLLSSQQDRENADLVAAISELESRLPALEEWLHPEISTYRWLDDFAGRVANDSRFIKLIQGSKRTALTILTAAVMDQLQHPEGYSRSEMRKWNLTDEERARLIPAYQGEHAAERFYQSEDYRRMMAPGSKEKILVLVRHGESMSNLFHYTQSNEIFSPLTWLGRKQADGLRKFFKWLGIIFGQIFSSDIDRAFHTIYRAIADDPEAQDKIQVLKRLREVLINPEGGIPSEVMDKLFPELWGNFLKDPLAFSVPGKDGKPVYSGRMVKKYLHKFFKRIIARGDAKQTIAATHGLTIVVALLEALEIPYARYQQAFAEVLKTSSNLGLTILSYDPEGRPEQPWKLWVYGDNSYLSPELRGRTPGLPRLSEVLKQAVGMKTESSGRKKIVSLRTYVRLFFGSYFLNYFLFFFLACIRWLMPNSRKLSDFRAVWRNFFGMSENRAAAKIQKYRELARPSSDPEERMFADLEALFAEPNYSPEEFRGRLRDILPPDIHFELTDDYFYVNSKKLPQGSRFFGLAAKYFTRYKMFRDKTYIRMLDFNPSNQQMSQANLVNPALPEMLRNMAYGQLSDAQKDELFGSFKERLNKERRFHIDHHYNYPVLATVSTTVLVTDFLLYLHRQGESELIEALQNSSFGLMDHTDADILLANFVITHALDEEFLLQNRELLCDTVLFNDYMRDPGSPERRNRMMIFYDVLLAFEQRIRYGEMTYGEAFAQVKAAMAFGQKFGANHSDLSLHQAFESGGEALQLSDEARKMAELFNLGFSYYARDRQRIAEMAKREILNGEIQPGRITQLGPVLFFYVEDNDGPEVGSYAAVRYLQSERPELLDGITTVVVSSNAKPDTGAGTSGHPRFFKIRSLLHSDGSFLNLSKEFWEDLRGRGLSSAWGRAVAGGTGKAPLPNANVAAIARNIAAAVESAIARQDVPDRSEMRNRDDGQGSISHHPKLDARQEGITQKSGKPVVYGFLSSGERSETRTAFEFPVDAVSHEILQAKQEFPEGVVETLLGYLQQLKMNRHTVQEVKTLFPDSPEAARRRIVFTGAPYGGKTTFLKTILTGADSAETVVIPEIITIVRKIGVPLNSIEGQLTIYTLKYLLELAASEVYPQKLIYLDRGTLDGFAYWPEDGADFLKEIGGHPQELQRYAAVIHWQSVASAEHSVTEFKDRAEDPNRAREIEELLNRIWRPHPRYYFILHTDWEDKTGKVSETLKFVTDKVRSQAKAPTVFDFEYQGNRYRFPNIAAYDFSPDVLHSFLNRDASTSPQIPLVLDLHFKAGCGLRCLFCYSKGGLIDERHALDESMYAQMTPEDIRESLRQYAAAGGHTVIILSIGEPLMNPAQFLEYARLAKSLGLRTLTFTNGQRITADIARQLREAEVNLLLKLNHLDPAINNQLAGRENPYRYVDYRGQRIPEPLAFVLEAYRDRPDLVALSSDITRLNQNNILEISRWAYETLGVAHFRKHLYPAGFAQKNRELLFLRQDEIAAFDQKLSEFDHSYGYQYPTSPSHADQFSFDMRRFLNNTLNVSGFPIRTFSHYLSGFYHSSGRLRPRFGYRAGIRVALRSLVRQKIDLNGFFAAIYTHIAFFRDMAARLRRIEDSFQEDKQKGLDPEQSNEHRHDRYEEAYQITRAVKRYLREYDNDISLKDRKFLKKILERATELARENPLHWIPDRPGVYVLGSHLFRKAYPKGEEFRFFTLHRRPHFYADPYQITYSITPPGHEQAIHGHFFTAETTVSFADHMGYRIYRFEHGEVTSKDTFHVPRYSGAYFEVRTPHTIFNESSNTPVRNMTVKFLKQVTDRWDLTEAPAEETFTYESRVRAPETEVRTGVEIHSFDKGALIQRTIVVEPGAAYGIPIQRGKEKGFFVIEGNAKIVGSEEGTPAQEVKEGDILYAIQGDTDVLTVIENISDKPLVLAAVDLKEEPEARLEAAKAMTFRALLLDIDGVLTDPVTGEVAEAAITEIVETLEQGVPVLLISGRPLKSDAQTSQRNAKDVESLAARIRLALTQKGKESLLGLLFLSGENGAAIQNGFPDGDAKQEIYHSGVPVDYLLPDVQEQILKALETKGFVDEHIQVISKEHGFSLVDALGTRADWLAKGIRSELQERDLLEHLQITAEEGEVHVYPVGINKILGVNFLIKRFSLTDEEVAAFADKGDVGQTDHKILSRKAGFSTDRFDSESPVMIRLRSLNGYLPGFQSFLWAKRQLHFEAPRQERTEMRAPILHGDFFKQSAAFPTAILSKETLLSLRDERSEMRVDEDQAAQFVSLWGSMNSAIEADHYAEAFELMRQLRAQPIFNLLGHEVRSPILRQYANLAYLTNQFSLAIEVGESLLADSYENPSAASLNFVIGMSYYTLAGIAMTDGRKDYGEDNRKAIDFLSASLSTDAQEMASPKVQRDAHFALASSYLRRGSLYLEDQDYFRAPESYQEAKNVISRFLISAGFPALQTPDGRLFQPIAFEQFAEDFKQNEIDPQSLRLFFTAVQLMKTDFRRGIDRHTVADTVVLHNVLAAAYSLESAMPERPVFHSNTCFELGRILFSLHIQHVGDERLISQAVQYLTEAKQLDLEDHEIRFLLAEALLAYANWFLEHNGGTDKVGEYLRKALEEFEVSKNSQSFQRRSLEKITEIQQRLQVLETLSLYPILREVQAAYEQSGKLRADNDGFWSEEDGHKFELGKRDVADDSLREPVAHLIESLGNPAAKIHNVGIGIGRVEKNYLLPAGYRNLSGLDLNSLNIDYARRDLGLDNPEGRFIEANFLKYEYPTQEYGTYDAVIITDLLHFFSPLEQLTALRKIARLLKPGGIVFVRWPTGENRVVPKQGDSRWVLGVTEEYLAVMLQAAGLSLEQPIDQKTYPLTGGRQQPYLHAFARLLENSRNEKRGISDPGRPEMRNDTEKTQNFITDSSRPIVAIRFAQQAASVFSGALRGELRLEEAAEKITVLVKDFSEARDGDIAFDQFLDAFIQAVTAQAGVAVKETDAAVVTAMNDISSRIRAYLETKSKTPGSVVVLSMQHEDMVQLENHATSYGEMGANIQRAGIHGLSGADFDRVRMRLRAAGASDRPSAIQHLPKTPDQIAAAAVNQNFVPVIFTGESRLVDAQKIMLLTFGIDPQEQISSKDSEDIKSLKDKFSVFMLWVLAAVAPYAEIDMADVKTVSGMMARLNRIKDEEELDASLAEMVTSRATQIEQDALQHIRAALIKELTKILSGKSVVLEGLFQNGLNLNVKVLEGLLTSYRAATEVKEAA